MLLLVVALGSLRGHDESGRTGRFWQLHISIMYPSGSWKKSWSTVIPPSSTTAVTYSIFISSSFCIMSFMSEHWNEMWLSFGFIAPFFVGRFSASSKCMPIPYLNNLKKKRKRKKKDLLVMGLTWLKRKQVAQPSGYQT